MEIRKMKWLAYMMVPFLAIAVSCKDDKDDDNNNNGGGNMNDGRNETVMAEIAASNRTEIGLGQVAGSQGTDTMVQVFGLKMVRDHQKSQNSLDSLADSRNIDLPGVIDQKGQALVDSMTDLTGMNFDTTYIRSQIVMHTMNIEMFENIADTTDDQGLKSYVNKYLPVIQMHLQMADSIANELGMGDVGNGGNGGNDTTGVGNDTTGVGNDTTGVGNDTTGVGNDTTGVGNDTTGVGNDTTGVGNDTTGVGNDTTGVGNDTSAGNGVGRNYSSSMYIRRR